jgi:hypothetical protein
MRLPDPARLFRIVLIVAAAGALVRILVLVLE